MEKLFFFNRDFLSAGLICHLGLYVCICHGAENNENNSQENGNAHGNLSEFMQLIWQTSLLLAIGDYHYSSPDFLVMNTVLEIKAIMGMIENKSQDFWQRKHCQRLWAILFLEQMLLILLFYCGQTDCYLLTLLASSTVNAKFPNLCLFCSLSKCWWTVGRIKKWISSRTITDRWHHS